MKPIYILYISFLSTTLFLESGSSSVQPVVKITSSDPTSKNGLIKGQIGKDVWMHCYVENLPQNVDLRWKYKYFDKKGNLVTKEISSNFQIKGDNMKWAIESNSDFSFRLRIKAFHENDEGNYTCYVQLTSAQQEVQDSRTIVPRQSPIFIGDKTSSDESVTEGDKDVVLQCHALGRPEPTIIWRRQGNAILPPPGGIERLGNKLTIQSVEYQDAGLYYCMAYNEMGSIRRDVTLRVRYPPKLILADNRAGQAIGYRRTLTCYVNANPAPSTDPSTPGLNWRKDNGLIIENDRIKKKITFGAFQTLIYELIINDIREDDYGHYECVSKTELGQNEARMELYKTDTPQIDKGGLTGSSSKITSNSKLFFILFIITNFYTLMFS